MKTNKVMTRAIAAAVALILFIGLLPQSEASALQGLPQGVQEERVTDPATGRVIFLSVKGGQAPAGEMSAAGLSPQQNVQAYLQQYAPAFGLSDPARELTLESLRSLETGGFVARYQQMYAGLPVFGAFLQVKTRPDGTLEAITGNVQPGLNLSVTPSLSPEAAVEAARRRISLTQNIPPENLNLASEPTLWIYDARLLDDSSTAAPRLVWEVKLDAGRPSLLAALVDAHSGVTRLEFEQRRPPAAEPLSPADQGDSLQALVAGQAQWRICTSAFTTTVDCNTLVLDNDGVTYRSSLLCTQDDPTACDDLIASAADAVRVYPAIESAYYFFYDRFGRDGWDGEGTRWDAHVNYQKARPDPEWSPIVFHAATGQAAFADTVVDHDLVAREYAYDMLAHDIGFLNIYQSGAIAESLADMWGEFIDQSATLANGPDNDAASVRWLIGEDVFPGTTVQYFRNMKTPPLKLHPDSMTSAYYYKGPLEYGRPLVNNGVNNKAAFLMVDGGSFGGLTVAPLGLAKTAAVYYGAQSYLFPSADYYDLYVALKASCNALIGTQPVGATTPISSADCLNVDKALKAVKMNIKPVTHSSVPVPACPAGTEKGEVLFADNFDSGDLSAWTFQANEYHVTFDAILKKVTIDKIIPIDDQVSWTTLDGTLTDDGKALYAPGITALSQLDTNPPNYRELDYADEMAMPANVIHLPPGKQIYLTFDHMFLFELTPITLSPYDGAVVEYSKDGGVTWLDAKPLFNLGYNYNGTVATSGRDPFTFNPLMGRMAFVKNSLSDRVTTRYNLSTLAGQNIRLRWRIGYDYDTYWGWAIDNVSVHTCIRIPSIPYLLTPANNALIYDNPEGVYQPRLDWRDSTPDLAYYQVQVAKDSKFTDLVYDQIVTASEFTPPDNSLEPNTRYYWRVRAFNINNRANAWSAARYFRTSMLRPENLSLPPDGADIKTRRPNFDWDDPNIIGAPATTYTIQIARQPDFAATSLVATYTTPTNATYFTATSDLPANTMLYWRVKANGTNPSQYSSEVKSFSTGNPPPVPVLVAPANNALVQPIPDPLADPSAWQNKPYLDWNIVTVPLGVTFDRYEVQVSDQADFSNLIVDEDIADINHHYYQVTIPLDSNKVYYWRVQSIAGGEDFSNWATRSFRTALLPPQTLTKPDDGQPAHTRRPTFEWTPVDGATGYTIQLSTLPTFASVQYTYTVSKPVTSYTHTADVAANTTYYWRIRSNGLNGPSLYSAAHSFTSGNPPTVPSLLAPAQNILLTVYTPVLDWGASVPATGTTFDRYEVQWANNPNFDAAESRDVFGVTNHIYALQAGEALQPNTTYYWRVRAWNTDNDFSAWSAVRYFRAAMLAPTLLYPIAGNNTVNTLQPVLDWEDVDGAVTYNVQISLYANMGSPFLNINTTDATSAYTVPSGKLQYGKTYYWRVRANGPNGPSLWSVIETFQPMP